MNPALAEKAGGGIFYCENYSWFNWNQAHT